MKCMIIVDGTRALRPKFLGSSQNSWDFWGFFGIGLGSSQSNPKKSQKIPRILGWNFSSKKFWDFLGWIPKDPKKSQVFWGHLGWIPKNLGSSQKNWGHFGMVWGRYTRVRNSHTEARKNIYIRHRDGINVRMYCKCVWLEQEVEVSRTCAEKHRIYQNIPANVPNPKKIPKKSQIFWDPKKIPRKSQKNPKFFGDPKTSRIPKKLNFEKSKAKRT